MDILKILQESGNDLFPDDLTFFETELDTHGRYSREYKKECKELIEQLRQWKTNEPSEPTQVKKSVRRKKNQGERLIKKMTVKRKDLLPEGYSSAADSTPSVSLADEIYQDILEIRKDTNNKSEFKKYVSKRKEIDSDFVDAHYSIFQPWELDAIISVRQMTEEFLEKYFEALDHDKIARYQRFSEGFFMKHFSQLDPDTVLRYGKNEWRDKEKRSEKLDVFLRLKGVRI